MIPRSLTAASLCIFALCLGACQRPVTQFTWGSYEDSLFSRQQHAGAAGEAQAASMLLMTITQSDPGKPPIGPGIHADYGYLLFKQGRVDEAIAELQKEAVVYPEAKPLMNTMISRIQERKNKEKEKPPTP